MPTSSDCWREACVAVQAPLTIAGASGTRGRFIQRVANAHDHAALNLARHQFGHDLRAALQPQVLCERILTFPVPDDTASSTMVAQGA